MFKGISMKKTAFVLLLLFGFSLSEARLRNLSLDMEPDTFAAHWWLGFDAHAFDKEWLTKEISCYFDEGNDDCHNLAALLRMYVEAVPKKEKLKAYGHEIKDKPKYDEYNYLEVGLFLFMYADDRSLYHLFDAHDIEFHDSPYVPESWDGKAMLKRLNSASEADVVETIKLLIDYPYNKSMHSELLAPMVALSINVKFTEARHFANKYLIGMGYLVDDGVGQGDSEEMGRVTITSMVIELAEYLDAKPISEIWKYHAKNISVDRMNESNFQESQLVHFFEELSYSDDPELKEKIAFIKKTKAYKTAKPSMKFMIAEHLMFEHQTHGLAVLRTAYKQGNNAMKSAVVAKYPELFPVKENFWRKLMKKSSEAELVMIKKNKAHWDEKVEKKTGQNNDET